MTKEKFKRLVARLEKESKQNPEAYQRKVFLWAMLGYSYAIFMAWSIVLLVALIGFGTWIALQHQNLFQTSNLVILGILLVVLLVLLVGSFRAKFPEPKGILLSRKQADKLHHLIDELRQRLKAPKVHRIHITDDFNAAIVQWPRLGIFGWSRNYLILGLPYLGAMSVEEMKSVIAHEMGHLSHQHSRRAGRIYQLRLSWSRMLSANEYRRTRGQLIFRRFLYWYAPIFSAYAFVLSRVNEYTADRCAAETIGRKPFMQSLIRGEIIHRYLDRRFWKRVYDRAATQVNPVKNVYLQMLKGFRIDMKPEAQSLWLEQALIDKTDTSDTHPCLTDRLEALGVTTGKGWTASVGRRPAAVTTGCGKKCR